VKKRTLTKIDRLLLIGNCIKAVTAVVGGSMVISNDHPYITLSILAIGAIANEVVSYIKNKAYGALINNQEDQNKEQI